MAIYKTKIKRIREIAKNTVEISMERPKDFSFKAGQYIQLSVNRLEYPDYKGSYRVFSIASSPTDKDNLLIAFRNTNSGFKETLIKSSLGTEVLIEGPHGFSVLPNNTNKSIVFIAGGIGITPYLSMIHFAVMSNIKLSMTLLYSNKDRESSAYIKELENIANHVKSFKIKNTFNNIDTNFIQKNIDNINTSLWYLAGPPNMINSIYEILLSLGIDSSNILTEGFIGY